MKDRNITRSVAPAQSTIKDPPIDDLARSHTVDICTQNAPLGSVVAVQRVMQAFPQLSVRKWACAGYCEQCARVPCIVLDDATSVYASDADELYVKLLHILQP